MIKRIQSKYAGQCARTRQRFAAGAWVDFDTRTRQVSLPERAVSDVFQFGESTFYRNKRGRCEDAPCCGCCTI
jgi:hypothetical protein